MQQSKQTTAFNPNLHGLRGMAAFMVFLHHVQAGAVSASFYPTDLVPRILIGFLQACQFGVELFFMISGYLIANSVIKHGDVKAFALDRCLRIYPAYSVILLMIFTAGPILHYEFLAGITPGRYFLNLASNFLFLPGLFELPIALLVAWSLSYEAFFYLVCALIFLLTTRYGKRLGMITAVSIALLVMPIHPRSVFFLIGIWVFFRGGLPRYSRILQEPLLVLAVFLLAWYSFVYTHVCHSWAIGGCGVPTIQGWKDLMLPAALLSGFVLFSAVIQGEGLLSAMLRTRLFQYLGSISYSFYLWHTMVMFVIKRLVVRFMDAPGEPVLATLLFMLISLPIAILVSHMSYRLVEVRFTRWFKRRLESGNMHATTPAL